MAQSETTLTLTNKIRKNLTRHRDHDRHPYVQERASAILKVTDGWPRAKYAPRPTPSSKGRSPQPIHVVDKKPYRSVSKSVIRLARIRFSQQKTSAP